VGVPYIELIPIYTLVLKPVNIFHLSHLKEISNAYVHHHTFTCPSSGFITKEISFNVLIYFVIVISVSPLVSFTFADKIFSHSISVDFNRNALYHSIVFSFNIEVLFSSKTIPSPSISRSISYNCPATGLSNLSVMVKRFVEILPHVFIRLVPISITHLLAISGITSIVLLVLNPLLSDISRV